MGDAPELPKERILCILPNDEPTEVLDKLRKQFPNVEITYITSKVGAVAKVFKGELDDLFKGSSKKALLDRVEHAIPADIFQDKTVLFTLSVLPESREQAPNLKLIHLYSAGTDRVVKHPLFLETDIIFTNSSGVHGPQITEWVIMTLLVHNHSYNPMYESQKLRKWDREWAWGMKDLVGQRIGVLGYGAIGRQVARVATSMGMEVYAYTATKKETPAERKDYGYIVPGTGDPDGSIPKKWFSGVDKPSLHSFLSQDLDVIVISVPLTPDTRHMLSTAEFELLAKHPPLISNIARGPIIDQSALVTALHSKQIAAATLDVTDPEPLPSDDPLWTAPNVIITPHISGASSAYTERSFGVLEENLQRLEQGRDLVNVISRKKGY